MWRKLALAAAAAMPLAGCASGAAGTGGQPIVHSSFTVQPAAETKPLASVASDYTLIAVDGHALPYAPPAGGDATLPPNEVVGGTLSLLANGGFTITTRYRETKAAQGSRVFDSTFRGACAPDGDAYRMYWDGGGDTGLTISGDTVTVNNNGVAFRYAKQQ